MTEVLIAEYDPFAHFDNAVTFEELENAAKMLLDEIKLMKSRGLELSTAIPGKLLLVTTDFRAWSGLTLLTQFQK